MKQRFYLVLLVLYLCSNLFLGAWGVTESSEARYADIAFEMYSSGDYLHPRLLDIQHFHKPPMAYYITALGYSIFGANEFGARFFLNLSLFLQVFFVFKIAEILLKDIKKSITAAIIFLSFPIVLIASRNLTTDSFLLSSILWAIYLWLSYLRNKNIWKILLVYVSLALGFLTKGPVVLLPFVVFTITYRAIYRRKLQLSWLDGLGIIIFLVLSGSWFFIVVKDIPGLWHYFIDKQIVKRSLDASYFKRDEPFWYYFKLIPLLGFPWAVALGVYFIKNISKMLQDKLSLMLLCTVGLIILIFSLFSSKLALYIVPAYPFMAICIAYNFDEFYKQGFLKWINLIIAFLILAIAHALILGKFLDYFNFKFIYAISILIAGVVVLILIYRNKNITRRAIQLSLFFAIYILCLFPIFASQNELLLNSTTPISAFIKSRDLNKDEETKFIIYNELLPSLNFQLDGDVITIHHNDFDTDREVNFEKTDAYKNNFLDINFEDDKRRLKELLKEDHVVLILQKKEALPADYNSEINLFSKFKDIGRWRVYYKK